MAVIIPPSVLVLTETTVDIPPSNGVLLVTIRDKGKGEWMPTYTMEQVAEELQVNVRTVKRWVKAGKVKVVRLGYRTVRISEEELNRIKRQGLR